jgi:hypothetical protein
MVSNNGSREEELCAILGLYLLHNIVKETMSSVRMSKFVNWDFPGNSMVLVFFSFVFNLILLKFFILFDLIHLELYICLSVNMATKIKARTGKYKYLVRFVAKSSEFCFPQWLSLIGCCQVFIF